MELVVRPAEFDEVRRLQAEVLRPHGPLPGDRPPAAGALYVAALLDAVVVGAATVQPEPWVGPGVLREPSWRLRGMVVAEGLRGSGIGRAVLERAVALAAERGAASMWAEARVPALEFYSRAGWTVGEVEWAKPGVGPHRYITRDLGTPPERARATVS